MQNPERKLSEDLKFDIENLIVRQFVKCGLLFYY